MERSLVCDSPVGALTLVERDGRLTEIRFGAFAYREAEGTRGRVGSAVADAHSSDGCASSPLLLRAAEQIGEYFAGGRQSFDLPLDPRGTPFQMDVWQALREIPCGEMRSYAEIARAIGRPSACRAVGMANHRNPIPIVIPCHRVVGSDGSLVGYGGGLRIKRLLLALERPAASGGSTLF